MSLAPTSRRGLALNCRLAVNGIHQDWRSLGTAAVCDMDVSGRRLVGIGLSLARASRHAKAGGHAWSHAATSWPGCGPVAGAPPPAEPGRRGPIIWLGSQVTSSGTK